MKSTSTAKRRLTAAVVAAGFAAATAGLLGVFASASSATPARAAAGSVLTMESSPQNAITDNFNPYVPSSASYLLGATSLMYEPLIQFDVAKPGVWYPWLATAYKWSNAGKTITFTIRQGVKWSDGSPMTAADVAFTFNLEKANTDINTFGIPVASATSSGNTATINFTSSQYTNLQNIAGQIYIVPQSIWASVGDPAKYLVTTPVGTGPYTLGTFTSQGFTLNANPSYWGGAPAVSGVNFPVYASNNTILSALQANQLDWAGNFLTGLQQAFISPDPTHHKVWFAPVNTNSLFPNLNQWPTNQLPVRKAISLAIDRSALSKQGEAALEPPATNASGLVLPTFKPLLAPSVKSMTLSAHGNPSAAEAVLKAAGYVIKGGWFEKGGKRVTIDITDPSAFTDYAQDDALVAQELRAAHIDATFVGQSASAWAANLASGHFQLSMHWSQTSISAYQLYDNWLDSSLISNNSNGNFERLRNNQVQGWLKALAGVTSVSQQLKYLGPIEQFVASNLPVIPTVYGAAFDEYNTTRFTGWPSASNPYESGSPNTPTNEVIVLRLKPVS